MTNVERTPKLQASQLLENTVLVWVTPQEVKLSEKVQSPGDPLQGLTKEDNSSEEAAKDQVFLCQDSHY